MSAATKDESDVLAVYREWCRAFQAVDAEAMKSLFDSGFDGIVYQAEESAEPMVAWTDVDAYWTAATGLVERIPEWRELTRKIAVDGDAAWIYAKLQTRLEIKGAKRPLVGELRVSIGLHRAAGGWKIVHYHESRHEDLAFLFQD